MLSVRCGPLKLPRGEVEPKCTRDEFPGITARGEMRRSAWRPLLVSARLSHCVAFNPSPVTSLIHPFIHPVTRNHVRVSHSPTMFSQCPALSCFHTHTSSCLLSRWLPHARYLAYPQPSSHIVTPHRTLTLRHTTMPSHCLTFTWLELALSLCFA